MINEGDQELFDKKIKEKLGKIQPVYEEDAWLAMTEKLEQQSPKPIGTMGNTKNRGFGWFCVALIVLLTTDAGKYSYDFPNKEISEASLRPEKQKREDKIVHSHSKLPENKESTSHQYVMQFPLYDSGKVNSEDKAVFTGKKAAANKKMKERSGGVIFNQTKSVIFEKERNTEVAREKVQVTKTEPAPNKKKPAPIQPLTSIPMEKVQAPDLKNVEITDRVYSLAEKEKKHSPNRKFSLGLLFTPDINRFGLATRSVAGFQAGFALQWRFNKNWALFSGLSYAQRNYEVKDLDLVNPQQSRFQANPLNANVLETIYQGTQVSSVVLEMPLELRFYTNPGKKLQIYLGAGFSSYYFIRQQFDNQYESSLEDFLQTGTVNVPRELLTFQEKKGGVYPFAVANLGLGLDYRLNKKFNLQAQPAYQFSLQGIGSEGSSLRSFGLRMIALFRLGK